MTTVTRGAPPDVHRAPTLTASHLAQLRGALEQQRAFRLCQLTELQRAAWLGYPNEVDRQIGQSLTSGARAALHDVLAALHRMDEGAYGCCGNCGAPLAVERLEVLPQAPLCMPCQRAEETAPRVAASTRLGGREHPDAGRPR
jgi:RNA polymerase-binding transcription factor DksA